VVEQHGDDVRHLKRSSTYIQVILEKTRSFAAAWFVKPPGFELTGVNDWLTCMTIDAVVKASMGLVRLQASIASTALHIDGRASAKCSCGK
jgi:hypothetical protein